jgi:hypothetical protein
MERLAHSIEHGVSAVTGAAVGLMSRGSHPDGHCGAGSNQNFGAVNQICAHLCALHSYAHDPSKQVIAHHYCTKISPDMHQCVLYDSPNKGAKLIGVEYLISEKLFQSLDADEKKLWHSHKFEFSSGMLAMPGMEEIAERPVVLEIADMYGKIIQTWNPEQSLPLGAPQLMVSCTNEEMVDKELWAKKDKDTNTNSAERREARKNEKIRPRVEGCDSWENGDKVDFAVKYDKFEKK